MTSSDNFPSFHALLSSTGTVNDPSNPVDFTRLKNVPLFEFQGGTISGTVNCGSTSGYIPVYILGESISALTATTGAFRLSNIPAGKYNLTIDTSQSVHHTITGISVSPGMQISLGLVDICCADNFASACKCPDGQANRGEKCVPAPSPM